MAHVGHMYWKNVSLHTLIIIIRTFIYSAKYIRGNNKMLHAAVNNCWRDKSSNAWQKTEQTVWAFSAQQVNCSMWLDRRPQNFDYPLISLFFRREDCLWCQTAVDDPEELKLVDKKLTQIRRCQTTQTLVNQHGGLEYNSLMNRKSMQIAQTHLWCGWISVCC